MTERNIARSGGVEERGNGVSARQAKGRSVKQLVPGALWNKERRRGGVDEVAPRLTI